MGRWVLEDRFHDRLGHEIRKPEVDPGNRHEAQNDGRRLRDLAAIGPLDAMELRPASPQERDGTVDPPAALAGERGGRASAASPGSSARAAVRRPRARSPPSLAAGNRVVGLRSAPSALASSAPRLPGASRSRPPVRGDALGTPDEGRVELVDVPGGMVESAGHVAAEGPRVRSGAPPGGYVPDVASRACDHGPQQRSGVLASLPMAGVATAPAAVLAQGDPVGVVALALVGLVVAMLAILAGEGDSDSDVSAGHVVSPAWSLYVACAGRRKTPPKREVNLV